MKASPRQQQLLLDLQDLDNLVARLRHRRKQLPERGKLAELQGEISDAKTEYMAVQRILDTQKVEIDRIEADIATVASRRARDNDLLAVSSSPKEAQALTAELEKLTRRQSELEDRELELMEAGEETRARFDAATAMLEGIDARRREVAEVIAEAERQIDAEAATAIDERAGLAAELQRDVLDLYETIRARSGIGAARLRGNVSEGSNMALAPAELSDIRSAAPDEIVFCPQSGAILVRVEDE